MTDKLICLLKCNRNSIDTVHTEASLCWCCFLPAWLLVQPADCVLVQISLYADLPSMKATVTLGQIVSTWPARSPPDFGWRINESGTMHKCKDSRGKTALSIPELKEWSPLSHGELILWNLAQLSDSGGTFFFFSSLSKHDSQSKPTNGCVAHTLVLQGLHCFASIAIPQSRHRFVTPCVHLVYYSSVINYRSNNKSQKGNIYL